MSLHTLSQFGTTAIARVEHALAAMQKGLPVLLVDDENRENEGDLILAAEFASKESVNFLIQNGSGIVCLSLTEAKTAALNLPLMWTEPSQKGNFAAAFTVSIEARHNVTTGVSAQDRATTILTAIADDTRPDDLCRPGHVFPLRARDGGVFVRPGHTEGSVDLARLAGLKPAGVICELMKPDGSMARLPDIIDFAQLHHLPVLSILDLIDYRLQFDQAHQLAPSFERPLQGDLR